MRSCMTALLVLSAIAFSIAGVGGFVYHSKSVALWLTYAGIALSLAAITLWIQEIITKHSDERPWVVFGTLYLPAFSPDSYPVIDYEIENISKSEVTVKIANVTCRYSNSLDPEYDQERISEGWVLRNSFLSFTAVSALGFTRSQFHIV